MTIKAIDFRVKDEPSSPAHEYDVKAGAAASIKAGQLVTVDGSNAGYVKLGVDGGSTALTWVGVAATDSTDTAAADGKVMVYDDPNLRFIGKPTTAGNLAQAIKNTVVTLDVADGVQTIDENDTTNGVFRILDYNSLTDEIEFSISTASHIHG